MSRSQNVRLDAEPLVRIEPRPPFSALDILAVTLDGPTLTFPAEAQARAQVLVFDVLGAKQARMALVTAESKAQRNSKAWRRLRVDRLQLEEFLVQAHADLVELANGVRLNHAPRHFWLTELMDRLATAGVLPSDECLEPTTVD